LQYNLIKSTKKQPNGGEPSAFLSRRMAWSLGFDEDDAFFRTSLEQPLDFDMSVPSVFEGDPWLPPVSSPSPARSLADENAELREAASSLRDRFARVTSVNAHLKAQLEECRSRFRTAMFSGFSTRK
jgi:hypothetical protein